MSILEEAAQALLRIRDTVPALLEVEHDPSNEVTAFKFADWHPQASEAFGGYVLFDDALNFGPAITSPGLHILIPIGKTEGLPGHMEMCAMLDAAHVHTGATAWWDPERGESAVSSIVPGASADELPAERDIQLRLVAALGLFYQLHFNLWSRQLLQAGGEAVAPIVKERAAKIRELLGELPAL